MQLTDSLYIMCAKIYMMSLFWGLSKCLLHKYRIKSQFPNDNYFTVLIGLFMDSNCFLQM